MSLGGVFIYSPGPGKAYQEYYDIHKNDKNFVDQSWVQRFVQLVLVVIFPFETLFLWFGRLELFILQNFSPHQDWQIKDSKFYMFKYIPRYLTHSMQLHFVHHLHPNIGHWSEAKAIIALKPFLIAFLVLRRYLIK